MDVHSRPQLFVASPARIAARDQISNLALAARERVTWLLSDSSGGSFPWYLTAPARRRRVAYLGIPGAGAVESCLHFESGTLVTNDFTAGRLARELLAEAGARDFHVVAPEGQCAPLPDRACDVVVAGPGASAFGVPIFSEASRLLADKGTFLADAVHRLGLFPPAVTGEPARVPRADLPMNMRLFPQEPGLDGPIALRGFPALERAPRPRELRTRLRNWLLSRSALVRAVFAVLPAEPTAIDALMDRFPPCSPFVELSATNQLAWFGKSVRVEIPITRAAAERSRRNAARLRAFADRGNAFGPVASLVPRLVDSGDIDGVEFFVEELRPGVTLGSRPVDVGIVKRALDLLIDLHRRTAHPVRLEGEAIDRMVRRPILDLLGFAAVTEHVRALADATARCLAGRTIPFVLAHGDFGPGNVLVDPVSGSISGLIDWDGSDDEGAPFADAVYAVTRMAGLPRDRWRDALHGLTWQYVRAMGLPEDRTLDALVVLGFASERRWHLASDRAYDPTWVREQFEVPVTRLLRALEGR